MTSLSRQTEVQTVPAHWWPSPVSLDAYRDILPGAGGPTPEAPAFMRAMLNSSLVPPAVVAFFLNRHIRSMLAGWY